MSLKSITSRGTQRGFTIVELLIVVVIIGILAAIVVIAYVGLTNRAKSSSAQTTGSSIIKKVEAYYAEQSSWPDTYSDLTDSSDSTRTWYIPAGTYNTPQTAALDNDDSEKTFRYGTCGTSPYTGIRVETRNYAENSTNTFTAGSCSGTPTWVSS